MRILVWNVERFTNGRITAQAGATPAQTQFNTQSTDASLQYIQSTVQEADPHVFVVLEAQATRDLEVGALATGNGPDGLLQLLARLRLIDPNWHLVPPLVVNPQQILELGTYTETVGVFWRDDLLDFTGPYLWPEGQTNGTGPSIAPGTGTGGAYPAPWNGAMPVRPPDQVGTTPAAQCRFFETNDTEITFPRAEHRRPFLTTFTERAQPGRSLRLFSVHTKPGSTAADFLGKFHLLKAADWVPQQNALTVFAGDFNVDLNNLSGEKGLQVQGLWLSQINRIPVGLQGGRYPPTFYEKRGDATPDAYLTSRMYDWAAVRYGAGAQPALPLPRLMVVDRVRGVAPVQPFPAFTSHMAQTLAGIQAITDPVFQLPPAPHGAVRNNGITRIITAATPVPQVGDRVRVSNVADTTFNGTFTVATPPVGTPPDTFAYAQKGKLDSESGGGTATWLRSISTFRQLDNFGHIGPFAHGMGTSDHLPIFFIV